MRGFVNWLVGVFTVGIVGIPLEFVLMNKKDGRRVHLDDAPPPQLMTIDCYGRGSPPRKLYLLGEVVRFSDTYSIIQFSDPEHIITDCNVQSDGTLLTSGRSIERFKPLTPYLTPLNKEELLRWYFSKDDPLTVIEQRFDFQPLSFYGNDYMATKFIYSTPNSKFTCNFWIDSQSGDPLQFELQLKADGPEDPIQRSLYQRSEHETEHMNDRRIRHRVPEDEFLR